MRPTPMKKLALLFSCALCASTALAAEDGNIMVAQMSDAKVFANFTDKLPAVVNYFTHSKEADILAFYREKYGEPMSQERKRGRLTSVYQQGKLSYRVVISMQNKMRQVDILVTDSQ